MLSLRLIHNLYKCYLLIKCLQIGVPEEYAGFLYIIELEFIFMNAWVYTSSVPLLTTSEHH